MTTSEQQRDEREVHLTDTQLDLYDRLSEISEDCYCARWIQGNEYTIWNAIANGMRQLHRVAASLPPA